MGRALHCGRAKEFPAQFRVRPPALIFGSGGSEVNFQVNDQTYFLDVSEDADQWLVFVETPTGTRRIPVYVDASPFEDFPLLVEDKKRRQIVN
jgi:hypothetical protein